MNRYETKDQETEQNESWKMRRRERTILNGVRLSFVATSLLSDICVGTSAWLREFIVAIFA